jgi:hypothetical protein
LVLLSDIRVSHRPSVSLNKEKVSRKIRENKIAVCEKTQGLWSGNFSDLNSACSKVLVPVKIFQFHYMHYENERMISGCSKQPIVFRKMQSSFADRLRKCSHLWLISWTYIFIIKHILYFMSSMAWVYNYADIHNSLLSLSAQVAATWL